MASYWLSSNAHPWQRMALDRCTIATGNRKRACISTGTHSKPDIDVTISQLMRACGRVVHNLQHSRCGLVL